MQRRITVTATVPQIIPIIVTLTTEPVRAPIKTP